MKNYIPYGRQTIDSDDIKAVEKVLLSDTTPLFELLFSYLVYRKFSRNTLTN